MLSSKLRFVTRAWRSLLFAAVALPFWFVGQSNLDQAANGLRSSERMPCLEIHAFRSRSASVTEFRFGDRIQGSDGMLNTAAILSLPLVTWARPYLNGRAARSQEDPEASEQANYRAG